MFLKQYNYKPRTGSTGSQEQAAAAQQPAAAAASNTNDQSSTISAAAAGRRRSSAGQFAGLQGHKRDSTDKGTSSFADQSQQSGVLGQMWTNFTKGTK